MLKRPVIGMMHHIIIQAGSMDLSIVYPVHITFATRYILKRLLRCLNNTTSGLPNAEHIIALSGKPRYIKQAKKLLNGSKLPIYIIDYKTPTTPYSPGTARNFAVKHANKNNLLFWDIDLLGSPQLYDAIPTHIETIQHNTNVFEMYPCLYLCNEYTKGFKGKTKQDFNQAWTDATNLKTNSIEHFAMATSTILCNKQHFLDIGAFDEEFVGHMGEDLELLNRLSIAYGQHPFEENHSEDWPSKVVTELRGFRKQFALYGLENLIGQLFTCHLSHSTRLGSLYKKSNIDNRNLLAEKLKEKMPSQSFKANTIAWPGYLTKTPNIKKKYLEVAFRKGRKIITNPKQFFSDITP